MSLSISGANIAFQISASFLPGVSFISIMISCVSFLAAKSPLISHLGQFPVRLPVCRLGTEGGCSGLQQFLAELGRRAGRHPPPARLFSLPVRHLTFKPLSIPALLLSFWRDLIDEARAAGGAVRGGGARGGAVVAGGGVAGAVAA